jgi:hypothetical protein
MFGIGLAVASLAFSACGKHSNTTPTIVSSASPVPTPTGSAPASLSSPCASSIGIAYEPDGGNGNGFNGIQVTHFEDNNEHLCAAITPTSTTAGISLDSSVGAVAFSQDLTDAVALLYNSSSSGYSYAQDIFGVAVGQLVPAGTPYNLSVPATPVPGLSPSASASPSPVPALITNGTSEAILGDTASGVALTVSPNTSPQGIVALTSLTNAPPQYGNYVPFADPSYTLKTPVGTAFNNIRTYTFTNASSATVTNVLVRGTNDLLSIGVSAAATGYTFNVEAEDTNLGSNVPLLGYGRMAINPGSPSHALVGGTSGGNGSLLTLITGLPGAITESSTVTLPGTITSIAFTPGYGTYAVVGTTAGIVVVGGTSSSTLSVLTPFSGVTAYTPTFTDCNGHQSTLTNIASVALSVDLKYLVALGTGTGVTCPSGYNATLIAVPFTSTTGSTPAPSSLPTPTPAPSGSPSPSPFPTFIQQNNVIAPPANADYLYVH